MSRLAYINMRHMRSLDKQGIAARVNKYQSVQHSPRDVKHRTSIVMRPADLPLMSMSKNTLNFFLCLMNILVMSMTCLTGANPERGKVNSSWKHTAADDTEAGGLAKI